jgi:hypothetical protein
LSGRYKQVCDLNAVCFLISAGIGMADIKIKGLDPGLAVVAADKYFIVRVRLLSMVIKPEVKPDIICGRIVGGQVIGAGQVTGIARRK